MSLTGELIQGTQDLFLSFGLLGLFVLAFIESSFFPIPPDVVLIPMALTSPQYALLYAAITTAGSVLGAVAGYYIGYKGGRPVLRKFASEKNVDRVEEYYDEYGVAAVGIAGFSPVPYKVFTISSGAFKLDFKQFMAVSVLSRGARFFIEAGLIMLYGEEIEAFLHGSFGIVTVVLGMVLVAAYFIWKKYL